MFSCKGDDEQVSDDDMMMEEVVDEQLIDNFLWERLTDSTSTIASRESYFVEHTFLYEDMVIYSNDKLKGFVAIDTTSGNEVWNNYGEFDLESPFHEPIIYGDYFCFASKDKKTLDVVNARTGERILQHRLLDEAFITTTPVIYENSLIFATAYPNDEDHYVDWMAIPLDDLNAIDWELFESEEIRITINSTPIFHIAADGKKLLITKSSSGNKRIVAFDIEQEIIAWQFEENIAGNSTFLTSDADHVYYNIGLHLFCLDKDNGNVVWKVNNAFINELRSGLYIHDDMLLAVGNEAYSFDKSNGNLIWDVFNFETEKYGSMPIGASSKKATIYKDHIYFYKKRVHSMLMKIEIETGDTEYFTIPDSREVEGLDVPLQTLDFEFSHLKISEDGNLYTNDIYRLFAFKAP